MSHRCGIVLAGGRGERLMLGIPKARAELAGRTLLERAVATLAATCDEVIVVAPRDIDPGSPAAARRAYDVPGHGGPLAGLVAGLEACRGETCAVLGVDFPLVSAALVNALLARLDAAHGADAVVPRPGGVAQPLVAALLVTSAAALRSALEAGTTSLRGGLERLTVTWLDDAILEALPGGAKALLNVNTPADLEAARHTLATGAERTERTA
jgi:molybdopterin-guanine dinucleotide biosynthesis protein A